MSGRDLFGAHSIRHFEKLIEFDEVIAERARNRRAAGKIILDEWLDHLFLEPLFEVDDIVGNSEDGSDESRIVYVIERAASADRAAFGRKLG